MAKNHRIDFKVEKDIFLKVTEIYDKAFRDDLKKSGFHRKVYALGVQAIVRQLQEEGRS